MLLTEQAPVFSYFFSPIDANLAFEVERHGEREEVVTDAHGKRTHYDNTQHRHQRLTHTHGHLVECSELDFWEARKRHSVGALQMINYRIEWIKQQAEQQIPLAA